MIFAIAVELVYLFPTSIEHSEAAIGVAVVLLFESHRVEIKRFWWRQFHATLETGFCLRATVQPGGFTRSSDLHA